MNASELIKERAGLLVRIEEINGALRFLKNPAVAVEISTSRNLRNTRLGDVTVYENETLTKIQPNCYHEGWITAADAAFITSEFADDIEDGRISIYEAEASNAR